jgi:hypothetical protein
MWMQGAAYARNSGANYVMMVNGYTKMASMFVGPPRLSRQPYGSSCCNFMAHPVTKIHDFVLELGCPVTELCNAKP